MNDRLSDPLLKLCAISGATKIVFERAEDPECEDDQYAIYVPGEEEAKGIVQLTGREFMPSIRVKGDAFAVRFGDLYRTRAAAVGVVLAMLVKEGWLPDRTAEAEAALQRLRGRS